MKTETQKLFRVAIVGASSLKGKELKDVLEERNLRIKNAGRHLLKRKKIYSLLVQLVHALAAALRHRFKDRSNGIPDGARFLCTE